MSRSAGYLASAGLVFLGGLSLSNSFFIREQAAGVPRMTCAKLARNGPGAGHFVTLTDLKPGTRGQVFWQNGLSPGSIDLYLPVYSAHLPKEPEPRELAFILWINSLEDRDRLLGGPTIPEFTCEVRRGATRLEGWAKKALAAKYPGIQLARCWVLVVGLHEPTESLARSALLNGIGAILLGVSILTWLVWPGEPTAVPSEDPPEQGLLSISKQPGH